MGIDIFDDNEVCKDEADLSKIVIDKDFAKRFEHNKKREALQKFKGLKKRGLITDSDESLSESSGSEEVKDDFQFYDALVRIKKNDPCIMQNDAKLFASSSEDEEEAEVEKYNENKKVKPLYLKDVMARQLMEYGPEFDEEPLQKNPKVYSREQVEGLKAFLKAEKEAFDSDDDDDVIIEQKNGTKKDTKEDENTERIHKKVSEYFGEDEDLSEDEMFLKNYCINTMWVDEKNKETYADIGVSEDEDELEKQEQYEAEYNFRHEEGNGDRVFGHSRIAEGSVRKKSSNRTTQRKTKGERMAQAEFERKEELKHLKNLKKKEIQEKLERIRATAGIGEDSICNLDLACLEEDFNPEEYDKAMKEMFSADYYNIEDADPDFVSDGGNDIEKPNFDKEDEFLGLTKDCDFVDTMDGFEGMRKTMLKENEDEEELSYTKGKRKTKRKICLREKVELDKELEEYYKLDYEGTIGDLKTRFKYRSVPADSYGLQTEEILMANDKDLNQYVSLKKLVPYREMEWKVTYHQKLKKNMILQGAMVDGEISIRKHKQGETKTAVAKFIEPKEANGDANPLSKRSRKRRMHAQLKLSKSRLIAYGKVPFKRHKKH